MTELHIPDEAVDRLLSVPVFDSRAQYVEHVDAIARPVVLAYLRGKSKQHAGTDWDYAFLHCIDELEAGT